MDFGLLRRWDWLAAARTFSYFVATESFGEPLALSTTSSTQGTASAAMESRSRKVTYVR